MAFAHGNRISSRDDLYSALGRLQNDIEIDVADRREKSDATIRMQPCRT